jgi:Na+/melibiose symporter-like transporter
VCWTRAERFGLVKSYRFGRNCGFCISDGSGPLSIVDEPPEASPDPARVPPAEQIPLVPAKGFRRVQLWLGYSGPEYSVGTLTYTRLGLFVIFLWLLWGDLVWSLMETVFPASMPLQLDRLGVPKNWTGYIMGTAGAMINMTFVPVISFRSDRTRSRWGRRIPFLLFTMPFLCFFLAILGFSDHIGAWIRNSSLPAKLNLSPLTTIIIVMALLILLYDVFNVFANSIYWYLFRDVIPSAFLGRFMAAFRMVGTCASMIWWAFIYGRIETHTPHIYVGAAIVYFLGFGAMCLMVKEGQYPPPEEIAPPTEPWLQRTWKSIRTYARECFSHPLFVIFYISQALLFVAGAGTLYKQYFFLRHLQFNPASMGKVMTVIMPLALAMQFPLGWLVDKIHPMRGYLIAITCGIPLHFAGYFIDTYSIAGMTLNAFTMYVVVTAIQQPLLQLREASEVPLQMRLFPRRQYGQFSSANAIVRHFSMIFGTIAAGTLMGWTNQKYGQFGNAYAFLWLGGFHTVACIGLWTVFLMWRRYGGEKFQYEPEEVVVAKP